jgi:putative glycosyltransferase (TIGR04372 family)
MGLNNRISLAVAIIRSERILILTMPLGLLVVLGILILKPFVLIRIGFLRSDRLGHFTVDHEIFLCEQERSLATPKRRKFDVYYFGRIPVCNEQLGLMWRRVLRVWSPIFLRPASLILRSTPLFAEHVCGDLATQDRDIHHLMEDSAPHLHFTVSEERLGARSLQEFGLPTGASFVCITVRDPSYLKVVYGDAADYHNYRNADIDNFVLAANELTKHGIFVFRMGSVVGKPLVSSNPMIIDYATNGMRSDFMDVYLGAKCLFCITTSTGFDGIPTIFRRPLVIVDYAPAGGLPSHTDKLVVLLKHHVRNADGTEMSFKDILGSKVVQSWNSADFEHAGVRLVENSPEEIHDAAMEMLHRIDESWIQRNGDEDRQRRFKDLFEAHPTAMVNPFTGVMMHAEIRCNYSANFLGNNSWFLES